MGFLSSSFFLVLIAFWGLTLTRAAQLRLCVTSGSEMQKCRTFLNIDCILGANGIDCVEKINNNQADITTLDGGDIYLAGKCHNMKPIITECSPNMEAGAGYYAVAVAKKSSHVNINTLAGRKSCHTGVNKTSGWFVPMSVLFPNANDQLQEASSFFAKSCVPGANVGSNLCDLCTPNCKRNSNNFYYGYDGAAKCLQETDADVAFVKHLTFLSNANRNDFELLCKDGTTASIDNYLECNLAKVPSHAIVAKDITTEAEINDIFTKLYRTRKSILFSTHFGRNKIFSSSTTSLKTTYDSYINYLGQNYIDALPGGVC